MTFRRNPNAYIQGLSNPTASCKCTHSNRMMSLVFLNLSLIKRLCSAIYYHQVEMQFLLDYPLGKKLERHLEFYVAQLGYEYETGRESSLEMLAMIFSAFPLVGHFSNSCHHANGRKTFISDLICFKLIDLLEMVLH